MYVHHYELFKMQSHESVKDMFTCFAEITNNLRYLSKTYSNEQMLRKMLHCLLRDNQDPKVTTFEEAQDLKKVEMDDILGKLLIHEIHLKENEGESPKRGIALKFTKEDYTSNEEEANNHDEEAFSLIVRGPNKMEIKKKFNQRGFN